MKKIIPNLCVILVLMSCNSQKLPKIKGDRNVQDVYQTLNDFNAIEIDGDFEVTLTKGDKTEYHIKADENIISVVDFQVFDEVLKIKPLYNITSSKRLEIDITYKDVSSITLKGDVDLKSKNKLDFDILTFNAYDNVEYDLDINVEDATFVFSGNTKGEIQLKGNKARYILNDNAYLKSDLVLEELDVEINKRADVNLKGDVIKLKLTATGNTDVKSKDLESEYANLIASGKSDIYVYASKELQLYAQGKSYIYVYGNPDIKVEGLNDKSQIIKK
ncbi:MAG: GIN domain-containing protein [Patiriisocius sp.]|uniref:GIN domain-containing protein n=1 Tax=Patiriisocius sp. TaxID=2822396 RepID=UPI003EF08CEE